jgi:hypothetical protein
MLDLLFSLLLRYNAVYTGITDVSQKNITPICRPLGSSLMFSLLFGPEDGAVVPPKRRLTYIGLHGFKYHKV